MNNEKTKVTYSGIGFTGLLTILFIALKLMGVISWSWVWVLAPIWICWLVTIIIFVAVAVWLAYIQNIAKGNRK